MSRQPTELQLGIYRHYKGPLYQVIGIAHDANIPGRQVVVYMPLQLDGAHLGPRMAVRTIDHETMQVEHGQLAEDDTFFDVVEVTLPISDRPNARQERFTYLGQELTAEMLGG